MMPLFQGPNFIKSLLFFPQKSWDDSPVNWGLQFEELNLATPSGIQVNAVWLPSANPEAEAIVFFHGNAGNLSHRFFKVAPLIKRGYHVLLLDYRGYGKSEGEINTEEDLYKDGETVLKWLQEEKNISPERIVLYGESLGGGIALEIAMRFPVKAIIIESTFTSLKEMAKNHYPLVPTAVIRDFYFRNNEKIKEIKAPILIIHGTNDSISPYWMGEKLYESAPEPKEFFKVEGAEHNNLTLLAGDEWVNRIDEFVKKYS